MPQRRGPGQGCDGPGCAEAVRESCRSSSCHDELRQDPQGQRRPEQVAERGSRLPRRGISMRRRTFLGLCGVGFAALLGRPQRTFAQADAITVGLTGSIFPGMSDSMLAMAAKPFRSLLEDATGMSGAVVQGGSPRELAGKLKKDEVQLGVFQ